ncbi:hypothetical protein CI109_103623 [Kwoniella shandongensis]|uniref:Uncharacterized protein n=1 Tax=Kwoniella shandongensis TaxID=1734106 RepID=A0A5M6C7Z4_9TREE|nr:uncharacterized protein CI109_000685 [Kwoniella shandongensis]KAA5531113.1 hypothetical protein CI109_000685 [Kwoniella shandongensis]
MSSSTTNPIYTISPIAYSIPILHAAAHPSSSVIGLFLSSANSQTLTSTSSAGVPSTSTTLLIADAVPLIHNYTSLSPMTEIGLELAYAYAKSETKRVVGIYLAKGDGTDCDGLGRIGERLLAKVREGYENAFALLIDNARLAAGQPAYIPYISTSSTGTSTRSLPSSSPTSLPHPFHLMSEDLPAELIRVIRETKVYRELRDFDDHLEDSSHDWLSNKSAKASLRAQFPQ